LNAHLVYLAVHKTVWFYNMENFLIFTYQSFRIKFVFEEELGYLSQYGLDNCSWISSRAMMRYFSLLLHPYQLWGPPSLLFNRVKLPGCEANHSPPPSNKVQNAWSYTSTHLTCLHNVVLN